MNPTPATFDCDGIILEGELHVPQGAGPFPCVVVCHPHPLYGGTMLSNVVVAICQALPQHSIAAFRFNFRGVGNSQGTFGGGSAEQEDVKAALAFVLSVTNVDSKSLGLAGYSFGASVALPVALQDERVGLLTMVSPALSESGWEQLKGYTKPKFIIVGDDDSFVPVECFRQHTVGIPEPGQCQVILGADHFWRGYEEEVAQRVAEFFAAGFNQA